jgi:hypothetical protein
MAVTATNKARFRAVLLSREVKWLFMAAPERLKKRVGPRLTGWFLQAMFLADDGRPHPAGEHVLADLREFALVGRPIFSSDPLIMARRLGRREVVERLINYLNLDEKAVQQLMELDDGIE